jgi:DNA-binding SARP family transcriptional activator/DNA-binding XRE family transcriptional regulator
MIVGVTLRAHRTAADMTQQQLAERAGVSVGAVRDIEQGRTVLARPKTLTRLATALDLNANEQMALTSLVGTDKLRAPRRQRHATSISAGAGVWLALLGPMAASRDGVPLSLGQARQQAVLGLLALHNGAGVSRAAIMEALWGSDLPPTALDMLQMHVSRIRRVLRGTDRNNNDTQLSARDAIRWDGSGYRLTPGAVRCDAEEFTALAERAGAAGRAGDRAAACLLYEQALRLWRGAPLEGMALLERHTAVIGLARQRAEVIIAYSDVACAAGQYEQVVGYLQALAQQEPLDERVHARLMIALSALGQQAAGLRIYEDLRRRLDEELGVRPGPELAAAQLSVLHQDFTPIGEPPQIPARHPSASGAVALVTAHRVVPRQLPPARPYFVGRAAEISALDDLACGGERRHGGTLFAAVGGGPGVGKSALAVQWSHQIADRFPDGQLYVDLQGYDLARPMAPEEAVRSFLRALQVEPAQVPASLDARVGLFRTLVAEKRMLIMLDNARSADQVRPLLPGSPTCRVLVTSRGNLAELAAEGVRPLDLNVLTHADARELLAVRLGRERVASHTAAADELIEYCARLPLALSVAAIRAAKYPDFPLATMAAELRDERQRLDALRTGDAATDVRAVFSWSVRLLSEPAARLFGLLGDYPRPDITGSAAASLAAVPRAQATRLLGELTRFGLLTEYLPDRFTFHDLLRTYAAERGRHVTTTGISRRPCIRSCL